MTSVMSGRLPMLALLPFLFAVGLFTIQPWSLQVGPIPLQVLLIWLSAALLMALRVRTFFGLTTHIGFMPILLLLVMVMGTTYRVLDNNLEALRLFQLATGVMLFWVSAYISLFEEGRRWTIAVLMAFVSISCVVAVAQAAGLAGWTWQRTIYFGTSMSQPSGLEYYPPALAYSAVGAIAFSLSLVAVRTKERALASLPLLLWLAGTALVSCLGLLVSASRSGLAGVAIAEMVVFVMAPLVGLNVRRIATISLVAAVVLGAALMVYSELEGMDRLSVKIDEVEDDYRAGKNWSLFLPVIAANPWGVPRSAYDAGFIGQSRNDRAVQLYLKATRENAGFDPHNFFLTSCIYFGLPTALAFGLFYVLVLYRAGRVLISCRSSTPEGWYLLCALGANIALFVHASFHNASPLFGEMRGWMWLGFLLALSRSLNQNLSGRGELRGQC